MTSTRFASICLLATFLTTPRKIIPDPEFADDPKEHPRYKLIELALGEISSLESEKGLFSLLNWLPSEEILLSNKDMS